jgi:hypothetical protein
MLAFLMDHQIHLAITQGLRGRGIDVVTVFEDGRAESRRTMTCCGYLGGGSASVAILPASPLVFKKPSTLAGPLNIWS